MNCRTESIFLFSMMGRGLRTTALNECAAHTKLILFKKNEFGTAI